MKRSALFAALFLGLCISPTFVLAQSSEEIKRYEEYCGLGEYGQGHTPGTEEFIACVNHSIGTLKIEKGLAKRYTGLNSGYRSQEKDSSGQNSVSNNQCLQAADYRGCMEFHSGSGSRGFESGSAPGTVDVAQPNPYSYEPNSVMQLKIRGSYGRYLTFIGKTVNEYAGTSGYSNPGSPGTVNCTTYGGYTSCRRSGYIPPTYIPGTAGGTQNRKYRYELDCKDMTFDRKGDYAGGYSNKGWMTVDNDPTAQAVANKYCSIMYTLPKAVER